MGVPWACPDPLSTVYLFSPALEMTLPPHLSEKPIGKEPERKGTTLLLPLLTFQTGNLDKYTRVTLNLLLLSSPRSC